MFIRGLGSRSISIIPLCRDTMTSRKGTLVRASELNSGMNVKIIVFVCKIEEV